MCVCVKCHQVASDLEEEKGLKMNRSISVGSYEEYVADLYLVMLSCNFRNLTCVDQTPVVSHSLSPSESNPPVLSSLFLFSILLPDVQVSVK